MVVQHTMSWFWDLKEHLDPENVTCDLRLSSTLDSAHFLRKSGQKIWKHFGDSVWICSCVFFTSIFAFVQEKHNMYLQVKHKKGQQSQFMKKKKGSWQLFTMLSSKYNYSLIHSCLEMHITPIMHSGNFRFQFRFATHGMPISNRLFWISCFPSMVMQSWMHNSIRQPACAHCRVKQRDFSQLLWSWLATHLRKC